MNGALDALSNLEKQTRLGSDMKSNGRIVVAMVCFLLEAINIENILGQNVLRGTEVGSAERVDSRSF